MNVGTGLDAEAIKELLASLQSNQVMLTHLLQERAMLRLPKIES